jgi:TRAP transporter 4TM/12TM fusion protein
LGRIARTEKEGKAGIVNQPDSQTNQKGESPPAEETKASPDAQRVAEEAEHGSRELRGLAAWLIPAIAGSWSLFQLSLASFLTLNSDVVRSIHLTFAIVLVFLSYPALRKARHGSLGRVLSSRRLGLLDAALALVAGLCAAHYALDYEGIGARSGLPAVRDTVAGVALILLLLEAARRSLGPALAVVAALFIAYGFFGSHMPSLLAFKGVSLNRMLGQLTMSSEGIYGVPLYVSASTVFLYVLFGAMLERTGGGEYFVRLAFSLLGRYKGGPAKAAVLSSGFTGMVSGSSIANVVTTGTFTIPLMKRCGYPAEKAAAIEVAASTNGQLMPPIMGAAAFIMAEYCNLPYFEVVRAAFLPAVISYIALLYITHLEASKLGLRGLPREELPRFWPTLVEGAHFLAPLILLITLLVGLRYSPEMSAFWAILALVGAVALRNLLDARKLGGIRAVAHKTGRQVWDSLVAGGRNMMSIGVAVAAAGIVVGIVSMGPGQRITEVVDHVAGGNIFAILVMTAAAALVLGMGLPTTANYIVMASLTAHVIVSLAGDAGYAVPLISAHLFCFYFGILADDTPPVGLAAYAASAVAKSRPIRTGVQGFTYDMRTAILPFMFFFNSDLLLWNVHGWMPIAAVAITGVAAMFAFASLTQRYLLTPNRWYDSIALLAVTIVLLRPLLLPQALTQAGVPASGKWLSYIFGLALFGGIYGMQHLRKRQASRP